MNSPNFIVSCLLRCPVLLSMPALLPCPSCLRHSRILRAPTGRSSVQRLSTLAQRELELALVNDLRSNILEGWFAWLTRLIDETLYVPDELLHQRLAGDRVARQLVLHVWQLDEQPRPCVRCAEGLLD